MGVCASAAAATFDEQRAAMAGSVVSQPEAAIRSLLQAGLAEGKPTQAAAEAQKWLRLNVPQDAPLLYDAGRATELSGDWKGAVALYRQYLSGADLTSETADEAVYAVYSLLLDRLNDGDGAYAFGRTEGDRLMVCPRARQFDRWYLDQAVRRRDAVAVANRLRADIAAGLPDDLLVARYDNYFRWLLDQMDTKLRQGVEATAELVAACKPLAAAITFSDELALRLDWIVSVRAYNQALLAGRDAAPPIAEATALLAKYPRYAKWVQDGWLGTAEPNDRDIHPNYVGDLTRFWADEVEAKMAPVAAAAAKLDPSERAELLRTWRADYYGRQAIRPGLSEVKPVRDYLQAPREAMNARMGALVLDKAWNQLSPEEALKLAPMIPQNAEPEASLVRAIAAGSAKKEVKDGDQTRTEYQKDYGKMMAALLGPEAWRLDRSWLDGRAADQLWHYCGRPGGNRKRDAAIAKSKALAKTVAAGDVKPGAPPARRLAAFRKLWADYRSAQPKIPGVYERLATVLQFTPEALPELLKDSSPEAQILARAALARGLSGTDPIWKKLDWRKDVNTGRYDPLMQAYINRHRGLQEMKKRYPDQCHPHPLESAFRKQLSEGLKQNKLVPWQVMAWINMQWPEDNAEQVKLMQALFPSPPWKTFPFEVRFAAREWFKKNAMTSGQAAWIDAANPRRVCRDLLSLTNTADVATASAALEKAIDGVKKSPVKINVIGLDQLAAVTNTVFRDPKVFARVLEVTDNFRPSEQSGALVKRLFAVVSKERDPILVQRVAGYLWPYIAAVEPRSLFEPMKKLTASLIEERPAAAGVLARCGVAALTRARSSYGFNPREHVAEMKTLVGQAAMKLGLIVIPVASSDPAYPVYKSQADWMMGNEDSAWALCDANWEQLLPVHRALSMDYLMWVLQRVVNLRQGDRQETLIKALLAWAREPNTPLGVSERAALDLAYGDIAVQRGRLDDAHKLFARIRDNKAYDGLRAQQEAALRVARVQSMAKDFDGALQTLKQLEMQRIPEMWGPVHYARAEVSYAMEAYEDAAKEIEAILAREPDNADARILQGRVELARKKLMEATEVEVGTMHSQKTLVPGEKLKVTLNDPTLAVSGAGSEIEVAVWAASGDRETFLLRQFGDKKTKFRGEVDTALGAPAPGDRVLQVIGDDQVYYDYSDRFREKMNGMAANPSGPIGVASDAALMASARKLLSEDEQRLADRQALMDSLRAAHASADDRFDPEKRAAAEAEVAAANERRLLEARVKPGNPIHVRVIDPDRSRTAGIDEAAVSVESSSGDSIGRVTLKETAPYSGWFEGDVPTAGAQAMAFAEHSEPGRNPNMVISPTPGYPAWRPVPVKGSAPVFKIDLNDNVPVEELTITAKEPGARLKTFALQTGMNVRDLTTVAVYPRDQLSLAQPWRPSVVVMNDTDYHHARNERSVYDLREIEAQVERGWMSQQFAQGIATNVAGPSAALPVPVHDAVKWKRQNRFDVSHVIYRFRGYFYEPAAVMRRFRLDLGKFQIPKNTHPSINHPAQFLLAVDGRPITDREKPARLEGEANLRAGLHRFEIWATGWVNNLGFGRGVTLKANLEAPGQLVDCPDRFFDPSTFPEGVLPQRNGRATVSTNEDGTQFRVTFAPGSRTRLLNLVCIGQEGPVPTLDKIALTRPDGTRVLPVAEDFARLNKNDTLEILTGDKVAVRYVDDRFVSKEKEKLERFLNVAFSSAVLEFADIEPRPGRNGEPQPYHERLLRFEFGKPLPVVVHDADMDTSVEPDTVPVTLKTGTGEERRLVATETGPSTGVFRAFVTPVPVAATVAGAAGAPAAPGPVRIPLAEGGTLTAVYRDAENTDPGVPTDRHASIDHAAFAMPQLCLANAVVAPLAPEERPPPRGLRPGFTPIDRYALGEMGPASRRAFSAAQGAVQARWRIENALLPTATPPAGGFQVVEGRRLVLEVAAPHLALRERSTVSIYVQTDAGRKAAAPAETGEGTPPAAAATPAFDIHAPGTVALEAGLAAIPRGAGGDPFRMTPELPIYVEFGPEGVADPGRTRFRCRVPLIPGLLPDHGVLSEEEIEARRKEDLPTRVDGLVVRPGERVYVGFRYTDSAGAEQWLTGSAKVITHPVLDVMEEDYRTEKASAYVGEKMYLRVVDLGADVSDKSDRVSVSLQAKSGAAYPAELYETDPHSGVFQGSYALAFAKAPKAAGGAGGEAGFNLKREGLPVDYGDEVTVRYTDAGGRETEPCVVAVRAGADGTIAPFSKRYEDSDIAMRTQFALAESFLEVARHHQRLGETEPAAREYTQAKQLLAHVMDQFRDPDARAHAEYLLGNLTLEEAATTGDAGLRESRYRAALSRFMNVTGTYPGTIDASRAQFKIATVFEQLKEPDIAAQEYVKLAYKYPDSEFLATAMARLGTHFQRKAKAYEDQAKPFLAKTDDENAQNDGKALQTMAKREYFKAANIFARLQERFPDNELAGKGGLLAGESYLRAGDMPQAVAAFRRVIDNKGYDGATLRSRAMYWAGRCYQNLGQAMSAYSMYKRLTYDFPETEWAAYARGQLSQERMLQLETDLEIKRLEDGR